MPATTRRQRTSNVLLALGFVAVGFGLLTAFSGFGLVFLVFAPLLFTVAAALSRSRWRVAAALIVWGCWFFGLYHVLT